MKAIIASVGGQAALAQNTRLSCTGSPSRVACCSFEPGGAAQHPYTSRGGACQHVQQTKGYEHGAWGICDDRDLRSRHNIDARAAWLGAVAREPADGDVGCMTSTPTYRQNE